MLIYWIDNVIMYVYMYDALKCIYDVLYDM
jgi:hypothetical protein